MNKTKTRLLFSLKILVPVFLLVLIFTRVDPGKVLHQMINIHPGYFFASLVVGFVLQIAGGAWRWRYFLKKVYRIDIPYPWILKHYWIGMFLGYFIPGRVGWDAYRIVAVNRRENAPLIHVTVVLLEKIIGLFACLILVMASYPLVSDMIKGTDYIQKYINYIYALAIVGALCSVAAFFMKSTYIKVVRWLEKTICNLAARFFKSFPVADEHNVLLKGITACYTPKTALALWGSSIFIRITAALGGYLVLQSLYADTSVMINFFATPLMLFLFLIPLSFGSIGIREGAFIILYGLFGIPPATALSASYVGLLGLTLTVCVGGMIMLWDNLQNNKKVID